MSAYRTAPTARPPFPRAPLARRFWALVSGRLSRIAERRGFWRAVERHVAAGIRRDDAIWMLGTSRALFLGGPPPHLPARRM